MDTFADASRGGRNLPQEGETDRLRRHLRAFASLNRQLHAQVAGTFTARRSGGWPGPEMVERLDSAGDSGSTFLVRSPALGAWVVEGSTRRAVNARLLYDALRPILEERRISDHRLEELSEGPPVEVLEAATGPAFLIVGGRAYPLRGLPLPYPVTLAHLARFPLGPELRVGGVPVRRRRSMRRVAAAIRRRVRRA